MSGSLFIFPKDPWAEPPAIEPVLKVLADKQLTAEPWRENTFLAGDGVFRHITFAGCSPHLEFSPPADGGRNFCHLGLLGPYDSPRMITGPNTLKPRCPQCRHRVADWRPLAEQWQSNPRQHWTCPECGSTSLLTAMRWRQHAVFGRLLIEIHSVFPGEAVPGDQLMAHLREVSGIDWDYGWAGSAEDSG